MGGAVPFGYDVTDKALMVNAVEAAAVRTVFAEYLSTGSVRQLAERLNELGVVSKRRTDRHGRASGGVAFSRGALYKILRNPIYIGKTRHKEELHEGLHDAIIDDATWQLVRAQLADHGGKKISTVRRPAKRLLDGLLFDSSRRAMRTTYASKSVRSEGTTRAKRYWYYTSVLSGSEDRSSVERLPANEIERVVVNGLTDHLSDKRWLAEQLTVHEYKAILGADIMRVVEGWRVGIDITEDNASAQNLRSMIKRIGAKKDHLSISVNLVVFLEPDPSRDPVDATFETPFRKRQYGRARPIIIAPEGVPQPDPDLIALIADARRWASELLEGKATSIEQITKRDGLRSGSVHH